MKFKQIFTTIILLSLFLVFFYFSGVLGVLEAFASIGIYVIIFYIAHILWKNLRKKEITPFYDYLKSFLYTISWFVIIIFGIFGGSAYYSNNINPAKMPEYTLSNGEKIVKFQTMVHIGSRKFYDEIIDNLTNFKREGGVYFFEGVKQGNEENMKKFNQVLGVEFEKDLYENFSKLYGVDFQNTSEFLGLVNDLDFNVDISIDDIMALYNKKMNLLKKEKTYSVPLDANKKILDLLSRLNDKQLKLLVYVNQAILNFFMNNDSILESISNNGITDKELFEVILGERNKVLANEIKDSEYDKIFVTYGLLHFKGVYEILKNEDSRWKIIEIKNLYPMRK